MEVRISVNAKSANSNLTQANNGQNVYNSANTANFPIKNENTGNSSINTINTINIPKIGINYNNNNNNNKIASYPPSVASSKTYKTFKPIYPTKPFTMIMSKVRSRLSGKAVRSENGSNSKTRIHDRNSVIGTSTTLNLRDNSRDPRGGLSEVTNKLLSLGYSLESINLAYKRYKFDNMEAALNILTFDSESGFYNHQFYPEAESKMCIICHDLKDKHSEFSTPLNSPEILKDSEIANKKIKFSPRSSDELISQLEKEFLNKELCIICYSQEITVENWENIARLECGHKFCKSCVKHYLQSLIEEGKVDNMKCLQAGCVGILTEEEIKSRITPIHFVKYKKFKRRNEYIEKIRNGYIPCTAPDCEEWVLFNNPEENFLECSAGHKFCGKCKEGWHLRKKCVNVSKRHMMHIKIKIFHFFIFKNTLNIFLSYREMSNY